MSIKMCKHGHPRTPDNVYKSTGACKECARLSSIRRRQEEPEKLAKWKRKWAENNPDKVKAAQKKFYANPDNVAKVREKQKRYYEENPEVRKETLKKYRKNNLDKCLENGKKWRRENPAHAMCLVRKRQAAKIQRTPPWLSREDHNKIKEVYELARMLVYLTGEPHHVDHIVPLRNKKVSGLHVPWNLQILTAKDNMAKHNKFIPGHQHDR